MLCFVWCLYVCSTSHSGAMATADLHHKMSKKIAQLTKVIYHLNTKNDDHDWEIKSLTQQYETEISEILKDAAAKIRFFQQQVENNSSDARIDVALKELQKQHQKEKEEVETVQLRVRGPGMVWMLCLFPIPFQPHQGTTSTFCHLF